ncbi:MAG TPA: YihY/virulence factor BrkB family protein [Roseiflexaceae bacterium]
MGTPPSGASVAIPGTFGAMRQFRTFCLLRPAGIAAFLRDVFYAWSADSVARLGAALAYYTLFSIAPMLMVLVGVVGLVLGRSAAQGQITPWLQQFVGPEGARAAQLLLAHAASPTGGILSTATGLITLFLGASAVVSELRQSLNAVWKITLPAGEGGLAGTIKSLFSDRLYAFAIVLGAGVLIILSVTVNTAVSVAGTHFSSLLPVPAFLLQMVNFLVSLGLLMTMFALVYKMVPDAHVAWGDAFIGAMLTALLFNVGGQLMSAFLGTTAGSVYGTAGSVLALLLWVYYSAQVFFFGAEATRIFAERYGGGVVPTHRSLRSVVRRHDAAAPDAVTRDTPPNPRI